MFGREFFVIVFNAIGDFDVLISFCCMIIIVWIESVVFGSIGNIAR